MHILILSLTHLHYMYVGGHTKKQFTGDWIRVLLLNLPFLFRDLIAPEVMLPCIAALYPA
jgi:hypothetical protein